MQSQQHNQQQQYIESKVLTAPSHKLHLMLIEGAIRFTNQGRHLIENGQAVFSGDPLMRALDILEELVAGVKGKETELNERLTDLYLFMYRRLAEAHVNNNIEIIDEVLSLLDFQRETWKLGCQQLEENEKAHLASQVSQKKKRTEQISPAPIAPHLTTGQHVTGSFSFEA